LGSNSPSSSELHTFFTVPILSGPAALEPAALSGRGRNTPGHWQSTLLPPSAALALFINRGQGGRFADPPKELRDKVGRRTWEMVEFKFDV